MMRIGFVFDLRDDYRRQGFSEEAVAEFDTPETIEGITAALLRAGCVVEQVGHGRALAARLAAGERFDLVFSIAEGVRGRNREGQVASLCELYDQPYAFSDTLTLCVALDKAMTKRIMREAGVPTAGFALLESATEAASVDLPWPLFVKPNAEGTGKGCEAASRVKDHAELEAATERLIGRFGPPVIVEPYLPGREFTVGITGTGPAARVIGVAEILVLTGSDEIRVYSLLDKEEYQQRVEYRLADPAVAPEAAAIALAAYRALDCRDAGRMDLREDAQGRLLFMEANPLAGLHPVNSDLPIIARLAGYGYDRLIGDILRSATQRAGVALPEKLVLADSSARSATG